ncbi:unnamed protein product [Mortierella alpina]
MASLAAHDLSPLTSSHPTSFDSSSLTPHSAPSPHSPSTCTSTIHTASPPSTDTTPNHHDPDPIPATCNPPSTPTDPKPLTSSALKRARRRHQRTVRLCSYATAFQNSRRLLTFIGAVNGRPAKILIDGGAEGNLSSLWSGTPTRIP